MVAALWDIPADNVNGLPDNRNGNTWTLPPTQPQSCEHRPRTTLTRPEPGPCPLLCLGFGRGGTTASVASSFSPGHQDQGPLLPVVQSCPP